VTTVVLQGDPGWALELILRPVVIIGWICAVAWFVRWRRSRPKPKAVLPVADDDAASTFDTATLSYQTPATAREENARRRAKPKRAARGIGCAVALIILLSILTVPVAVDCIGEIIDMHHDAQVRQWMDGPRNDPLVAVRLTNMDNQVEADLNDAKSLAYLSAALPAALRNPPVFLQGARVAIELHFQSGRVISTHGYLSPTDLEILNPGADETWNEIYDIVDISFGTSAPAPIRAMELFLSARDSTGKQSF